MKSNYSHKYFPLRSLLLIAACMALGLSGCAGAKRAFGMQKVTPDEFTVVTKAPLVVPPDYALRPPQPGAAGTNQKQPSTLAEYAMFGRHGEMSDTAQGYTGGEINLLEISGGSKADPKIRQLVNNETASLIEKSHSITEDILFWQDPPLPGEVVNPVDEKRRLEENAKSGKKPDVGDTKHQKPRKKGLLEGLF